MTHSYANHSPFNQQLDLKQKKDAESLLAILRDED